MSLIARSEEVEDAIRAELIRLGVRPGLDVMARGIRRVVMEKYAVCTADPPGAVSDPDALALALHHVFEGWVCHLPADDPDWRKYADGVLAHLGGQ